MSKLPRKGGGSFNRGSSTLPLEQHKLNFGFVGIFDFIVLSSYQSWAPQCSQTIVGGPKSNGSVNFPMTTKTKIHFFFLILELFWES